MEAKNASLKMFRICCGTDHSFYGPLYKALRHFTICRTCCDERILYNIHYLFAFASRDVDDGCWVRVVLLKHTFDSDSDSILLKILLQFFLAGTCFCCNKTRKNMNFSKKNLHEKQVTLNHFKPL